MFDTQIIVDADHGDHGWEIVLRYGPEDMIASLTDMDDDALRAAATGIGTAIVGAVLDSRDGT